MTQSKANSILLIVGGAIAAIILTVIVVCGISYISANNYGVATEARLKAAKDNVGVVMTQYEQKLLEAAQVPDMYKNDFKELIKEDIQGRYGKDGSKAMFQWIQERQMQPDAGLYKKLMQITSAGRTDIDRAQKVMVDQRQLYEAQLGLFWRGMWLKMAGFPRVNLDDYKPILVSRVETALATGKEEGPIKLR